MNPPCKHCGLSISDHECPEKPGAKQDIPNPPRFQDLNYCFLERAALAMTEGFEKYEHNMPPEQKNYMRADLKFALSRIGNAIKHLTLYNESILNSLRGDESPGPSEDHLGHAAANLNMLAKWEEMGVLPNTRKIS